MKRLKKILILIAAGGLISFASSPAQIRNSIEGSVVDAKTNEPLAYVNVFLSQTTIGASTNEKGIYRIGNIPPGNFILVASMVGYESKTVPVRFAEKDEKKINIALERSVYEFRQIEVKDEIPKRWFDQLEIFKKQLFGNNEYARKCTITNPYQIDFTEENSKITAFAREPIIIRNSALGYRIDCVLKSFVYDINGRTVSYQIYPSFTELVTSSADSSEEYLSNRKDAYTGSMAQLLSSLAVDNYKFRDDGFEIHGSGQLIKKADEIVQVDSLHGKYFLKTKDCLLINYWNYGKRYSSRLCLTVGLTEFDPSGFLIHSDEFAVNGDMAREGVATMLPRFWKLPED